MSLDAIVTKTTRQASILALVGEINSETVEKMDEAIDALLENTDRVVLDLSQTLYVSSAGWRSWIQRGSKGPQLRIRIAGMRPSVFEVFNLLGLNHVVAAHDTVAEAIAAFERMAGRTVEPTT